MFNAIFLIFITLVIFEMSWYICFCTSRKVKVTFPDEFLTYIQAEVQFYVVFLTFVISRLDCLDLCTCNF